MASPQPLLAPVIALVTWTAVMWAWMYATRIPAILRLRIKLDGHLPRGEQMATLPAVVRWKADNYNHLFEQPVLFYATALALAVLGDASTASLALAWAYVALRIVHSLWQATVNRVPLRFALFALSTFCLLALSVLAVIATLG